MVPPSRSAYYFPHAPFGLSCSNSSAATLSEALLGHPGVVGLVPRLDNPPGVCYGLRRRAARKMPTRSPSLLGITTLWYRRQLGRLTWKVFCQRFGNRERPRSGR